MAEQASFFGAAWPSAPPLPFPTDTENHGEIPAAFTEVSAGGSARAAQNGLRPGPVASKEAAASEPAAASAAEKRRAYNREYMRAWRQRNLEHYRAKNREYQRRTARRRKLRRIAQAAANAQALCAFGCGRPATQTAERIDPRTWKPYRVPYCGHC
ncbi:MAG TPA: hypothetical protein VNJ52_13495 [Patescibacteria group bacterium]|nr:hypothetical protein [Patescibacteria group bacterium]